MRPWVCLALTAACVFAGCRTKGMKSTPFYEGGEVEYVGDASERVNLWPVAYWHNPAGSVVWPITSFSDDHFAFRPVYSQYRQGGKKGDWDEFNLLWPIAQADTRHRDYRVFPVFWGDSCVSNKGYQAVFPLYWNGPRYNALFPLWYYGGGTNYWTFHTAAGLAGARQTKLGYRSSWAFPLWYEDNTGLFTTPFYGRTPESYWVFPLWYKGEKAFVSPVYAQGEDDNASWWAAPAALSWGSAKKSGKEKLVGRDTGRLLLGLGGWDAEWGSAAVKRGNKKVSEVRDRGEWWCLPFVNRKWDMHPCRHRDRSRFETSVACGLSGWETHGGDLESFHLFPLFSWKTGGSWLTPLGGRLVDGGCTNTVYTPLVGVRSGKATGGWAFPLWSHKRDSDFDRLHSRIDAPKLPEDIRIAVHTNNVKGCEHRGKTFLSGKSFSAYDNTAVLLHDADHTIHGNGGNWFTSPTNEYTITERRKRGNRLLLNYESGREVKFDLKSRGKFLDKEDGEASFLLWLYRHEWKRDRSNEKECARHRVLWRLWDWVDDDGDVSLDVFPGFTYDSRRDGYTKTSLLWRFFRYETDQNKSAKLDLLYVPIVRRQGG